MIHITLLSRMILHTPLSSFTQTNRDGGLVDTEHMALTVRPAGPSVETTETVAAVRLKASRKSASWMEIFFN